MFAKFICWLTRHRPADYGPKFSNYDFSSIEQRCSRCGKKLGYRHF